LFATIWAALFQASTGMNSFIDEAADNDSDLANMIYAFVHMSLIATISTICSCYFSIVFVLLIRQTTSDDEAIYFFKVLSAQTLGIGTLFPFLLGTLGVFLGSASFVLLVYIYFGVYLGRAIMITVVVIFCTLSFTVHKSIGSFMSVRETSELAYVYEKKAVCSVDDLRDYMKG